MRAKSLTILGRHEAETFRSRLRAECGYNLDTRYEFLLEDWKGGLWVASRGLSKVDFSKSNVVSIGFHLAAIGRDGKLRIVSCLPKM